MHLLPIRRCLLSLLPAGVLTLLLAGAAGMWLLPWLLPAVDCTPAPASEIRDRHGELLGHVRDRRHYRCHPLPPGPLPQNLVRAVLWAEDQNFYHHPGIDPTAILRALRGRLLGTTRSGASTISMQLVKISRSPAPRNLPTKLRESLAARRLEMEYSKDTILRTYLDRVDFGNLCRGAEAAAQYYFSRPASDLTLPQAALLAVLIQSPSRYDPIRHPREALTRRNQLLQRMGVAAPPELGLQVHSDQAPAGAPAGILCLDRSLQESCRTIARDEIRRLRGHRVSQAALLILHNPTGQILARIPAALPESSHGGQLDGTRTRRSAGSTLKPLVYLLAFEHGLHPGSILADLPTLYPDRSGIEAPHNYNRRHLGPISIRQALACSQNIPAMEVLNRCGGPGALLKRMADFGIHPAGSAREYGLGLAIGNAHVTLEELARAYATLARGGSLPTLHDLMPVPGPEPQPIPRPTGGSPSGGPALSGSSPSDRVADARLCYLITDILSDSSARAASFGDAPALRFPYRCAVKTGTSSNYRDNWCIGYTADYTVAVWVGNFDNSPMDAISGISGAAPIFHRCMEELYSHRHPIPGPGNAIPAADLPAAGSTPDGTATTTAADSVTATAGTSTTDTDASTAGTPDAGSAANFPQQPAGLTRLELDTRTGLPAAPQTPADCRRAELIPDERIPELRQRAAAPDLYDAEGRALLDFRYTDWLAASGLGALYAIDPERDSGRAPAILVPAAGSHFILDPNLPDHGRTIELLSTLPPSRARWHSPTLPLHRNGNRWFADLLPGEHTIILEDAATGETVPAAFSVEKLP